MGLFDRISAAFKRTPTAEPEMVPPDERALRGYLDRALVQGDLGMTAISMSGAQPPQRRGNIEVMRAYSTGPMLRGVVGKVSTNVAAVPWKTFASPEPGQRGIKPRMSWDEIILRHAQRNRIHWRQAPFELSSGDLAGAERALFVRDAVLAGELIEIQRHPFASLMARPNAVMSGRVARQVTCASFDLVGDSAWILGGAGSSDPAQPKADAGNAMPGEVPVRAWPIPGVWIQRRPTLSEPWWVIQIGAGSSSANATTWNVPWDALLLFNDPDPLNPYGRGAGLGFSLGDEVDIDEAAAKTVSAFFHNNAMPAALVAIKGARREVLERAKREWNNLLQGFKKSYKVHFTGGEIDVKRMDTTFKDMELIELRKAQRDIIQQVYGVPPEVMGINDNSSWATSSAADHIFAKMVLVPRLEVMREQFQRLASYFDTRLVVEYDNPIPVNLENRRAVMAAVPHMFRIDEHRALADEQPIGDESGRGFIHEGVWWGSLSAMAPKISQAELYAGIPTVDEARLRLRLKAQGAAAGGDQPTPRRAKDGDIAPLDPNAPPPAELPPPPPPPPPTPAPIIVAPTDANNGDGAKPVDDVARSKGALDGFPVPPNFDPTIQTEPGLDRDKRPAPIEPSTGVGDAPILVDDIETRGAEHLTPDQLRHITNAVDVSSMLDALQPEVEALIKSWGQQTIDAIGGETEAQFNMDAAAVRRHLRELGTKRVHGQINHTTRTALKDALHKAERDYHDEKSRGSKRAADFMSSLLDAIEHVFAVASDSRSATIGTSQATASGGFANVEGMVQSPVEVEKEWIATNDDLVRDTHLEMDGQRRKPDEDFNSSSGAEGPHPGELGEAAEDINCRCVCGTVVLELHSKATGAREVRGLIIGTQMLAPDSTHEERALAWRAADSARKAWDARLARAARDGFDKQHVRVIAALKDTLG